MKLTKQLREILIKDNDQFPFVGITKNYGRASFNVCPVYKYNKLVELYIYPTQQKNIDYYYKWVGHGRSSLTISSYQGLQDPKIWQMWRCKEHKTNSFQMYAPNESNYLWISVFSFTITIGFLKNKHK